MAALPPAPRLAPPPSRAPAADETSLPYTLCYLTACTTAAIFSACCCAPRRPSAPGMHLAEGLHRLQLPWHILLQLSETSPLARG